MTCVSTSGVRENEYACVSVSTCGVSVSKYEVSVSTCGVSVSTYDT